MSGIENIQNEILVVGSFYSDPELFVKNGKFVRSNYDFADEVTRFFFEHGEIIYAKRNQKMDQTHVNMYFSENEAVFEQYKSYGGWKTISGWKNIASPEDFEKKFDLLKKFSLLREFSRNGFDVQKLMKHRNFNRWNAKKIHSLIRAKVDQISTVILSESGIEILNKEMKNVMDDCLERPDMGLPIFQFPILNDLFRGFRTKTSAAVGMLSNAGKSRFMFSVIAHMSLVQKEKTLVLLNEMSHKDMKLALLTTVINNPAFVELHGIELTKKERELALGLYRDNEGEIIYREMDEEGSYKETLHEFKTRLRDLSEEYVNIEKIARWIEEEEDGLIYVIDVSDDYSFDNLEHQIRKMNIIHGIKYYFYDTLKTPIDAVGDWAAMKKVATQLSELCVELDMFVYFSIQLTDDTNHIEPLELNSTNIASAKQIKHILTQLLLFKEIEEGEIYKYRYLGLSEDWGDDEEVDMVEKKLDPNKRYYSCVVDKNRAGAKKKILFALDLDLNIWEEIGELVKT